LSNLRTNLTYPVCVYNPSPSLNQKEKTNVLAEVEIFFAEIAI